MTERIPTNTGVRQGDSLSPILFNLIMDEVIGDVTASDNGYRIGNQQIKIVCYADDAVLISENEDGLQRLLHSFQLSARKWNMIVSVPKTQSLVIAKELIRCNL